MGSRLQNLRKVSTTCFYGGLGAGSVAASQGGVEGQGLPGVSMGLVW